MLRFFRRFAMNTERLNALAWQACVSQVGSLLTRLRARPDLVLTSEDHERLQSLKELFEGVLRICRGTEAWQNATLREDLDSHHRLRTIFLPVEMEVRAKTVVETLSLILQGKRPEDDTFNTVLETMEQLRKAASSKAFAVRGGCF